MQPRITSPALRLPGAAGAFQALGAAAGKAGLPQARAGLVHLRVRLDVAAGQVACERAVQWAA